MITPREFDFIKWWIEESDCQHAAMEDSCKREAREILEKISLGFVDRASDPGHP